MQADGFNLNSISRLLSGAPGAADRILGLKHLAGAPFQTEEPEVLTAEELAERFGAHVGPKELAKTLKTGVLVDLGGGRYEAPSPSLLRAAEEVIRSGVSLSAALGVVEQVRRHSEAVARSFVQLFLNEVWKPFEDAGHPEGQWPEVLGAIERLRPIASEALLAVFQGTMTREVDGALGKELERLARRSR